MKKEEKLQLDSAGPINDGGRRWNFIYYISAITMLVLFIAMGSNLLGWIFGIALGCVIGWLIKNKVAETHAKMLRYTKFVVQNKIPYSQLIHELIPRLTPLGALVEKSLDGKPVIDYQGAMYDVRYNEDDTFCIWWRQNLVRAFFSVDYIKIYRREVMAMGIIGYHIQQICETYDGNTDNTDGCKMCKACGAEVVNEAKFCVRCGTPVQ